MLLNGVAGKVLKPDRTQTNISERHRRTGYVTHVGLDLGDSTTFRHHSFSRWFLDWPESDDVSPYLLKGVAMGVNIVWTDRGVKSSANDALLYCCQVTFYVSEIVHRKHQLSIDSHLIIGQAFDHRGWTHTPSL